MSGRARYARPGIRGSAPGFLNFPTSGKTGKKGGEGGGLTGRNQDVRVPRQRRRRVRRSNPGATSRSLSNEREMKLKTRSSAEYFGAPATHARRPHAVGSSLITPLTYFACRRDYVRWLQPDSSHACHIGEMRRRVSPSCAISRSRCGSVTCHTLQLSSRQFHNTAIIGQYDDAMH